LAGGASINGNTVSSAALDANEVLGLGATVAIASESMDVAPEEDAEGATVSVEASVSAAVEENIRE
jgi:hypothetical protein